MIYCERTLQQLYRIFDFTAREWNTGTPKHRTSPKSKKIISIEELVPVLISEGSLETGRESTVEGLWNRKISAGSETVRLYTWNTNYRNVQLIILLPAVWLPDPPTHKHTEIICAIDTTGKQFSKTKCIFMVALWNRADHYVFILFLSSFFCFFLA